MRVLMINDLAGVAGALCKYLRKAGHEADCISFMDDHEFGFSDFYRYRHFKDQRIFAAMLRAIIPEYDIIHLHFSYPYLQYLHQFTDKPIVMHYHGTEIALNSMQCQMADRKCKMILVAGEQLLQYHPRAQWLPTIVDTEHFYPKPELRKYGLFTINTIYTKRMEFPGFDVKQFTREESTTPYSQLPDFLNEFEGYIDVRYHTKRGLLTDFSKTALESLACGLKVYHNDKWHTELPEQHRPENVVKQLIEYYEGAIA